MHRRRLGPNGPEVSAVGYGAMSFANFRGPATEAGSHAILDACLELGIEHIDTLGLHLTSLMTARRLHKRVSLLMDAVFQNLRRFLESHVKRRR